MIFGYSLAEAKKTVTAAVIFVLSAIALFVAYDPGIKEGLIVLVGNGFAVAGVFLAPKFSIEDLSKTLAQLSGSVFSLLTFFVKFDPSLPVVVGSIIALIPIGYAVWRTGNLEAINRELPPVIAGPPVIPAGAAVTDAPDTSRRDLPPAAPAPPPPGPPTPPVPPADRPAE